VATETNAHSYDDPIVLQLVQEMADDLARHYGPASYPPQDPGDWAPPVGGMFVVVTDGVAVGCAGFVRHDATTAELKRMFVRPSERRRGTARRLLHDVESEARSRGYRRMVLETGTRQVEAQHLYRSEGFSQIPCWAPYREDPTSLCFAKMLTEGREP
jgi:GNAT superfamily N-acetyltransferase